MLGLLALALLVAAPRTVNATRRRATNPAVEVVGYWRLMGSTRQDIATRSNR
jgi:hypothetical protein